MEPPEVRLGAPGSNLKNTRQRRATSWNPYVEDFDRIVSHPYPGKGTAEDPFIINWLDSEEVSPDMDNPLNWPSTYKWTLTMLVAMATLAVGFCSSAYTGAVKGIQAEFDVSTRVLTLGVTTFVLGFALGPLIWAPFSEVIGRRPLFIYTYFALTAFNAGASEAPSMAALLILRLLAGSFGSSPLTNAGGTIADIFHADQRGVAMAIFAAAPFMGPVIGPIVGGFAGDSIGWRWVHWIMTIFTGVMFLVGALFLPETYAPVLLRKRAKALSAATGRVYKSKYDGAKPLRFGKLMKTSLSRPWVLLFREPIVFILSIYLAIVYMTLYLMFGAFPIVFQRGRHWSSGIGGLAFVGIALGMMVAVTYVLIDNKRYIALNKDGRAPPEARLPPAIVGACSIPVGLFWFAWANDPSLHWAVPIAASIPFGFGMVLVFLACMNYLIDSYVIYAASVLAASAVLRSLFAAIMPLFTSDMYESLGIHWASSIPAFLALACLPFPYLFWKYGASIRGRCKYASEAAAFLDRINGVQTSDLKEMQEDKQNSSHRQTTVSGDSSSSSPLEKSESMFGFPDIQIEDEELACEAGVIDSVARIAELSRQTKHQEAAGVARDAASRFENNKSLAHIAGLYGDDGEHDQRAGLAAEAYHKRLLEHQQRSDSTPTRPDRGESLAYGKVVVVDIPNEEQERLEGSRVGNVGV
ncbi:MFS siderochrome iron transporter 1 [Geranomyces variabilis]|nr:MFS siderochrome iron transporter 1 [Geranomyces variabilis]